MLGGNGVLVLEDFLKNGRGSYSFFLLASATFPKPTWSSLSISLLWLAVTALHEEIPQEGRANKWPLTRKYVLLNSWLQKLHLQDTLPPPPSFAPGPSFLVTYFHKGYFFSWACCLAKTGLYGVWAPLAADGALDGRGEPVVLGGIGGEALDGAFLPFLWPLPPPLADWDIPFLVWWLSLQSSPQIRRNALGTAWKQWIAFKSPSKLLHLHIKLTLNQLLPFKWQIERQQIEFKWTRLSFSAGHVSCLRDSCPVFGTRWKFVSDSMEKRVQN